jgi:hypothetical protein
MNLEPRHGLSWPIAVPIVRLPSWRGYSGIADETDSKYPILAAFLLETARTRVKQKLGIWTVTVWRMRSCSEFVSLSAGLASSRSGKVTVYYENGDEDPRL